MPKSALESTTVRKSAWSGLLGLGVAAISWLAVPENVSKIEGTAKIWGVERHAKMLLTAGGLATSLFSLQTIHARHKKQGEDAIYTPPWAPGRNKEDCVPEINLRDVLQAVEQVKGIAEAQNTTERIDRIVDSVVFLSEKFDRISGGGEVVSTAPTEPLPEPDEFTLEGY